MSQPADASDKNPKKRPRPSTGGVSEPRRKSSRLSAALPPPSSDPIDFLSTPDEPSPSASTSGSRVELRRIPNPRIPESQHEESEMWDPDFRAPLPERSEDGTLVFASEPHFTPNMTPEEMIRSGSFGGTAFRYAPTLSKFL